MHNMYGVHDETFSKSSQDEEMRMTKRMMMMMMTMMLMVPVLSFPPVYLPYLP